MTGELAYPPLRARVYALIPATCHMCHPNGNPASKRRPNTRDAALIFSRREKSWASQSLERRRWTWTADQRSPPFDVGITRAVSARARPWRDFTPSPRISSIIGKRSAARASDRFAIAARPAARVASSSRWPSRFPPSFTPRAFAAAARL